MSQPIESPLVEPTEAVQPPPLPDVPVSRWDRLLDRFPPRCRTALRCEVLSNLAAGAYLTTFSVSLLFLKGPLAGPEWQVGLLAMFFFGSSLFSPLVTYLGRVVPMKTLVVLPNVFVGLMLALTLLPGTGSLFFAVLIGSTFVVRVFPRAAEMNMYRILYPDNCRGTAIGITKAVGAVTALATTFVGWAILANRPEAYPALFTGMGALLLLAAWFYSRIPVPTANPFAADDSIGPVTAFVRGARVFLVDRRFLAYQLGFSVAGIANHLSLWYVVDVLEDGVHASETVQAWVVAILPALFVIVSSPIWGRVLDGWNPMSARAVFNGLQGVAFCFYALGGLLVQSWPFVLGAICHAIGNGGGLINWLTGSMYFAKREHVSLYNGIHVCLTGVRGIIGPVIGIVLSVDTATIGDYTLHGWGLGWGVFVVSAVMSIMGSLWMLILNATDTGPADPDTANSETMSADPV